MKPFLAVLLAAGAVLPARAESATPDPHELLARVRANQAAQHRDLTGYIRKSSSQGKTLIPFNLLLRGNTIIYQFPDKQESLTLRLSEKGAKLDRVSGSRLREPIRGTDITYEDLTLQFLYWPNAVLEPRKEILMTRSCWIVRVTPPPKNDSQYDMVRLWIESSGGLLQAEGYAKGKLVRRFTVRNVQSARDEGGGYILKAMSIASYDERGKSKGTPTYLVIQQ